MRNLTNAGTDKLQIVTSSGADIDVIAEWIDSDQTVTSSTNPVLDRTVTAITTATTTDIVATPAASKVRKLKGLHGRNIDASVSNDLTLQFNANGTIITLKKFTLLASESFSIDEKGVFFHYDANGGVYGQGVPTATQADMEAASSTSIFVSPGRQHYHPAHPKVFVSCGVAADIQQSFGVSSLTDNGTGDLTVNFSTSFSAATYCAQVTVEMTGTTYPVASMRNPHVRSGGRATGSCRFDCVDQTSATSLIKDPTTWHIVCIGDQ